MDCLDLCLDLYDKLCSFMAVGVLLDEISQEKHGTRERERERERRCVLLLAVVIDFPVLEVSLRTLSFILY